jgi:hypothetical protein
MATRAQRKARRPLGLKPGEDEMKEANGLVNGDRQASYGSPRPSYLALAKVWSGMLHDKLKEDLTAEDAVLLLAAMKLRREAHKSKRDNRVDTHGYLLVLAHVKDGQPA